MRTHLHFQMNIRINIKVPQNKPVDLVGITLDL